MKVDSDWLKNQVAAVLSNNRVTEPRTWNGNNQVCIFHAPLLNPRIDYPPWLLPWLKPLWRSIKLPWQVSYPHQWFWDSCAHSIVLSYLDMKLAEGEIESLLYISRSTVKNHIYNLYQKMGVKSRVQLIHLVMRNEGGFIAEKH